MHCFYSGIYQYFAAYPEAAPDETVLFTLKSKEGVVRKMAKCYRKTVFALSEDMEYTLEAEGGEIAFSYLFEKKRAPYDGIFYPQETNLAARVPFRPQQGKMENLCGACRYRGMYHIFYSFAPFEAKVGVFYLGHAVSADLLHFKEMPPVLEPPEALLQTNYRTGGIVAGVAEAAEDRIRLSVQYKIFEKKTGKELFAYTTYTESRDGVHFSPEVPTETMLSDIFSMGRTHVRLKKEEDRICWQSGSVKDGKMRVRKQGVLEGTDTIQSPHVVACDGKRILFATCGGQLSLPMELTRIKGELYIK